jgi:hypothetical protein
MSSVVLDNSASSQFGANTSTLTANSVRVGAGGVSSTGPVNAIGNAGQGSVFTGAWTISDDAPAPPATQQPSSWTTFASQTGGGGLNPNQIQKYAYSDPRVGGPQTIQEYEQGGWVPTATAFVAPALAVDTAFINRPLNARPLDWGAPLVGTFTCAAAPVVVPCAGITAGSVFRISLVAGSAAAFTAAAAAGITAPALTIQLGATTAASTFTATGGEAGMVYAYEVLRG